MMKPERMYVDPEFKRTLKVVAASKGKDIVEFTKQIVSDHTSIEEVMKDWNGKIKRNNPKKFDFL